MAAGPIRNPITELTLSPIQGSMNSATALGISQAVCISIVQEPISKYKLHRMGLVYRISQVP
jgi:hypothetical protein